MAPSPHEALALQNVTARFDDQLIFKDVSLSIFKNESFVLVGPSGQGKSVLIKILAGLLNPTSGKVLWDGQNIESLSMTERIDRTRSMGMLFQKNALFDSLTVFENVAFPLRETTQLDESSIQERCKFYLDAVDLSSASELYPSEISGGMQKRLGIARALALNPSIIFYDDPTAGLDPITSRKIIQLILELKNKMNSTIITITNDMNRAYQLAHRIAMVVDQTVLVTGNEIETKAHKDPRVIQFIRGELHGPLTDTV